MARDAFRVDLKSLSLFFLLTLACTEARAQDRYPTLASFVDGVLEDQAEARDYFFLRSVGDIGDCRAAPAGIAEMDWLMRHSTALQDDIDWMMFSSELQPGTTSFGYRQIMGPQAEDPTPRHMIMPIIEQASEAVAPEWTELLRARERLRRTTNCRDRLARHGDYVAALRGYARKVRPYDDWIDTVIAVFVPSDTDPMNNDMANWRQRSFELISPQLRAKAALASWSSPPMNNAGKLTSDEWIRQHGSTNTVMIVTLSDFPRADAERIAATLSEIEGPFRMRRAATGVIPNLASGEFAVYYWGNRADGSPTMEKLDRLREVFGNLSQRWREHFYK